MNLKKTKLLKICILILLTGCKESTESSNRGSTDSGENSTIEEGNGANSEGSIDFNLCDFNVGNNSILGSVSSLATWGSTSSFKISIGSSSGGYASMLEILIPGNGLNAPPIAKVIKINPETSLSANIPNGEAIGMVVAKPGLVGVSGAMRLDKAENTLIDGVDITSYPNNTGIIDVTLDSNKELLFGFNCSVNGAEKGSAPNPVKISE